MTTKQQLIIDTDPGIDDALATPYLPGSSAVYVLGMTTVVENAATSTVACNAASILELGGRTYIRRPEVDALAADAGPRRPGAGDATAAATLAEPRHARRRRITLCSARDAASHLWRPRQSNSSPRPSRPTL